MEASTRVILSPPASLYRLLPSNSHASSLLLLHRHPHPHRIRNPRDGAAVSSPHISPIKAAHPRNHRGGIWIPWASSSISDPLGSQFPRSPSHRLDGSGHNPKEAFRAGTQSGEGGLGGGGDLGTFLESGMIWTAVLLGWLGADIRHLNKYAEMYRARGIRVVAFVVPVGELIGFDLGRRVDERIASLTRELVSWLSETDKDGRERCLFFHTFSNTGWLTYGAILENLQSRRDIIEKIKGCVIDSGPEPELNPQVWAAGFCAALLKKRSSLTYSSVESVENGISDCEKRRLKFQDVRPSLAEVILLSLLEKFFTKILGLPNVKQRLNTIISTLSMNQPLCPQLYLYSSVDKVIPVRSVEYFIQEQKVLKRRVFAHNFGSSPHVDHFRSFPHIYSTELDNFLKECSAAVLTRA